MKTVITSSDRSTINIAELIKFSGLLRMLSLRDVIVRYKQTRMGFAWSIIRPVINIFIFGFLSFLVDRSEGFAFKFITSSAGVVFWQLISTTASEVGNSLSTNSNILTKVYFPKLILPVSSIFVCLVDFLIAFILFFIIYLFVYGTPPWLIMMLPLVVIQGVVFGFSIGLLAATASVKFRDVKFILPFFLQILFYASPVFINSDFVLALNMPGWVKTLYQLNPLVFMMNAFKQCFFYEAVSTPSQFAIISVVITLVLLLLANRYFMRTEKTFTDYI
jgi:lipopolysaccharide transport system permease protein